MTQHIVWVKAIENYSSWFEVHVTNSKFIILSCNANCWTIWKIIGKVQTVFFTNMMLSAQFYTFFSKNTFCKNSEAQIVKKIKNNLGNQKLKNQKNKYWWQCDNFLKPKCFKHKYINSILQQNKFNTINFFGFDIVWCSIIEGNVVFSKTVVVIDAFTFKPTIFV